MPRQTKAEIQAEKARITADDLSLFRKGAKDVNWITDHYMKSPTSGTYWRRQPQPFDPERAATWLKIWKAWKQDGRPDETWVYTENGVSTLFKIQWDENDDPIFFHNHGFLFQPWQWQMHHAVQSDVVCIGGFGCGKTSALAMSFAVCLMTIPYFRGFHVAPQLEQSMEVFRYIKTACSDTPFWNRFVVAYPEKPYPRIVVRNSFVGESTLNFYSVEHNSEKIRTLEGDYVACDQAEMLENLFDIRRDIGSRLRGQIHGRQRMNKMVTIANAGDNPQLWELFDMAKFDPQNYLSLNPTSYDNPFLTAHDLERMTARIGGSPEQVRQWMLGQKPLGKGEQFSAQIVERCTNRNLNEILDRQVSLPNGHPDKIEGFVKEEADRVGVYHFEFPPDFEMKRSYMIVGDPGQGSPPGRNSPVIMVWDITDFPKGPMVLRAFHWVFGEGSYWPFLLEYERLANLYRCQTRAAFDSTGVQKGFDELVFNTMGLLVTGMDMSGPSNKLRAINAAKLFMGRGLMQFPYLPYLSAQLTKYVLPDTKISQDLVMALCMAAGYANDNFYGMPADIDEHGKKPAPSTNDRYRRPLHNRFDRTHRAVR
jgi:hypothetical protein